MTNDEVRITKAIRHLSFVLFVIEGVDPKTPGRGAIVQQIKIFKGIEHELTALEEEVNAWLVESQVEVLQIVGNISPQTTSSKPSASGLTQGEFPPSDVMIIVLYKRPPRTA